MKPVVSLLLAGSAATLLVLADSAPLATLPVAGTLSVAESGFAGNHRLWAAAALLVLSLLASLAHWRAWPVALAGLAAGWLGNLCCSAWLWRGEKLELLAMLGQDRLAQLIEWRSGLYFLAGGVVLAWVFLGWEIHLERRRP